MEKMSCSCRTSPRLYHCPLFKPDHPHFSSFYDNNPVIHLLTSYSPTHTFSTVTEMTFKCKYLIMLFLP